MHFQWYPGHMTKAKRMMQENIKLIDLVIELVDARIPISSRNPDIDELGKNKARLVLLNKADLAEDKWNDAWAEYFKAKGYSVVKVNSKKGGGIKSIQGVIREACKEKIERDSSSSSSAPDCSLCPAVSLLASSDSSTSSSVLSFPVSCCLPIPEQPVRQVNIMNHTSKNLLLFLKIFLCIFCLHNGRNCESPHMPRHVYITISTEKLQLL